MKKVLGLLLVVAMLLSSFAGAAFAEETVELTMLSWRSEDTEILNEIGEMFTAEHPNITVTFDIPTSNETEYYNVMKTRLMSSQSTVDILGVHPGSMTAELVEANKLVELTDTALAGLIEPDLLESEKTEDGKIYGVPQTFQAYVIFYNKDIFAECGLEAPETWDELMNVASVLRENGYGDLVKVEESAKWGELKKLLAYTGEIATIQSTGEIVEGVTAYETPATFTVDI